MHNRDTRRCRHGDRSTGVRGLLRGCRTGISIDAAADPDRSELYSPHSRTSPSGSAQGIVKILLDENFPLPLLYRLRAAGYESDHIISLGQRGLPDSAIRGRLAAENLLFLTQDLEFAENAGPYRAVVVISGVPQNLPLWRRIEIWLMAIERYFLEKPAGRIFELTESGKLLPWENRGSSGN